MKMRMGNWLLPYLVRFGASSLTVIPHVMIVDNIIPAPQRRTGIAAARRAAKNRRRAKR